MRKIYFLSASDRLNYGDLLFPILFKKVLEKNKIECQFFNHGIVKSDLRYFNALKTASYKSLVNNIRKDENPIVVIGGGESLFPTFTTLYSYVNSFFYLLVKSYKLKKIENRYSISSRVLTSQKIIFPFCPSKKDLKNESIRVFYNSVGGTFNNVKQQYKELLVDVLNQASYFSVRDLRSYRSMKNNSINVSLSPDSALIMSDYFNLDFLIKNCSSEFNNLPEEYFVLQLAKGKIPENFSVFFKKLLDYSKTKKNKIVLCPIGLASGHDDYVYLKKIHLKYPETILVYPKNIEDIMLTISNSKCYFGTSLHGLITAQSFNVPFYLFNKNVMKLKSYVVTWLADFFSEQEQELSYVLENWNKEDYLNITNQQKGFVYENYNLMFKEF